MARKLILLFVLNLIFSGLHAQRRFIVENIEPSFGKRFGIGTPFEQVRYEGSVGSVIILDNNEYVIISGPNDDSTTLVNIPNGYGDRFKVAGKFVKYNSSGVKVDSHATWYLGAGTATDGKNIFYAGGSDFYPVRNLQPGPGYYWVASKLDNRLRQRHFFQANNYPFNGRISCLSKSSVITQGFRVRNGVLCISTYRFDSTGVLFTGDSSHYPTLRQDITTTFGIPERVDHNRFDVASLSGHQLHVYSFDTLGRFFNGRLIYSDPLRRQLNSFTFRKSPLGGYFIGCYYDSIGYVDTTNSGYNRVTLMRLDDNFNIRWRRQSVGNPSSVFTDGSIAVTRPFVRASYSLDSSNAIYFERFGDNGDIIEKQLIYSNQTKYLGMNISGALSRPDGSAIITGSRYKVDTIWHGPFLESLKVRQFGYSAIISNFGIPYQPYIPGVGPNSAIAVKTVYPLVVYPNPAHDVAYLQGLTDKPEPFTLLNQLGQAVRTGTVSNNQNSLHLHGLPTGLYVLALRDKRLRLVIE